MDEACAITITVRYPPFTVDQDSGRLYGAARAHGDMGIRR
jgi:hypothetical protein